MVDADSCPVKKEIVEISNSYHIKVVFVSSFNSLQREQGASHWHYVDTDKEAADMYIINRARSGDVVVTHDTGLAALLLPKNVYVIHPRGFVYSETDIFSSLQRRYLAGKERRQGRYPKGPKKFTKEDRERFCNNFKRILSKIAGI